jgi:hypothetical protein
MMSARTTAMESDERAAALWDDKLAAIVIRVDLVMYRRGANFEVLYVTCRRPLRRAYRLKPLGAGDGRTWSNVRAEDVLGELATVN